SRRARCLLSLITLSVNAPATTEIYTLSLHDALPIFGHAHAVAFGRDGRMKVGQRLAIIEPGAFGHEALDELEHAVGAIDEAAQRDRKSTRLNSSHVKISYAVFCLKKKKKKKNRNSTE